MRHFLLLTFVLLSYVLWAQDGSFSEKPPMFPECQGLSVEAIKPCFDEQLYKHISSNFKMPSDVDDNFTGNVSVLFEVDKEGSFKVLFVDALFDSLKEEAKRVFGELPKIQPSTYNGMPSFSQYSVVIKLPFGSQKPTTNEVWDV
ncbi:MAG: gliding motility protein RemB, partial [Mangrovimonas sp.]|nr:gliding motility protein RemB [Mangrovimonas sp.]